VLAFVLWIFELEPWHWHEGFYTSIGLPFIVGVALVQSRLARTAVIKSRLLIQKVR